MQKPSQSRAKIVDFARIPPVPCPCGAARRAFADVAEFPGTVHQTDITDDAVAHYHRRLTEIYYILDCGADAQIELDGTRTPLAPGMCFSNEPGVYVYGELGIRHEDVIFITEQGAEGMTKWSGTPEEPAVI